MNYPSVKTLAALFSDNAKQARSIIESDKTGWITSPSVDEARRTAYNHHKKYYIKMLALSDLGEFYGVESAETTDGEYLEYLNAGDTYALTLLYWRGRWIVSTLGDFVETKERQNIHFI